MKILKTPLLLLAIVIGFIFQPAAQAQSLIKKSVLGSGGGAASNSGYIMIGTLGQPLIGVTQNSSNIHYLGFWYPPASRSANVIPTVHSIIATFQDQTIAPVGADLAKVLAALTTPVAILATASDPDPSDTITKVRFDLDGQSFEDTDPADGWSWPNLDLGLLSPTSSEHPNLLTVVAFDSRNASSLAQFRNLNIIAQPCWINTHTSALVFQEDKYKFDLRFPKPIYGLDYTTPKDLFLIGGLRFALGLDFDALWEHSILSHQDLKESLVGYITMVAFNAELVRANRAGTLVINDKFDIEQAKVKWTLDTGFRSVYKNGIKIDIVIAKVNIGYELFARFELDLNMAFDNCLMLGPNATLVPVVSGKGTATASAEALFGVASASVSASPGLSLWLITPLTDAGNWGAGGEVWLDWSAKGKIFWVFKFSKSGRFGPYAFGKPRPSPFSKASFAQLQLNEPDISAEPAIASDSTGNLMLVWVKDTAPAKGLAMPQIHTATWNAEQGFVQFGPLTPGDKYEYDPAVEMDSQGNAMVIWTRNKLSINDTSRTFEEILANTEIVSRYYDAVGKTWSSVLPVTNDNFADGLADVAISNQGAALCVWTHTKDNDLATRNDWEIKYAVRQGSSWTTPGFITNDNAADHSVKVAMNKAGRAIAVWTRDADADGGTLNDIDIQYAVWNGNNWLPPRNLTNTIIEEHHPAAAFDAAGAPHAAWVERKILSDSSKVERLMFSKGDLQTMAWSIPETVFADSLLLETPSLKITTRAGQEIAMLSWRSYDGTDGDMFLSLKNLTTNTPWSQPKQVSQDTLVDWMPAAVFDSRNNAMILSVKTDLYNPATDNSKLGNFGDGIQYFAAGIRSNLQLKNGLNVVGGYLGDVTGEGKITALDALVLETYRLGLLKRTDYLQRIALGFGDVNFDGASDAQDVRFILQYAVEEAAPAAIGKWIWF